MAVNPNYGTPASSSVSNAPAPSAAAALPPIQFSSISPRVIDSAAGATVTVSGSNLSSVKSVKLEGKSLTFKLVGDQLQVVMPAHAVGYADLTFVTNDISLPLSNAVRYSDVLNTHLGTITLLNPSVSTWTKTLDKFAKLTYVDCAATYSSNTAKAKSIAEDKLARVCTYESPSGDVGFNVGFKVTYVKNSKASISVNITGRIKN